MNFPILKIVYRDTSKDAATFAKLANTSCLHSFCEYMNEYLEVLRPWISRGKYLDFDQREIIFALLRACPRTRIVAKAFILGTGKMFNEMGELVDAAWKPVSFTGYFSWLQRIVRDYQDDPKDASDPTDELYTHEAFIRAGDFRYDVPPLRHELRGDDANPNRHGHNRLSFPSYSDYGFRSLEDMRANVLPSRFEAYIAAHTARQCCGLRPPGSKKPSRLRAKALAREKNQK
jgi:hypothetical protein